MPRPGYPALTHMSSLHYSARSSKRRMLVSMSPRAIEDDPRGQLFEAADGTFVSLRLPDQLRLPRAVHDELEARACEWEAASAHILRGDSHAAMSIKFVGDGQKADQDSQLANNRCGRRHAAPLPKPLPRHPGFASASRRNEVNVPGGASFRPKRKS